MAAPPSDFELLQQYTSTASKKAFSQLVSRHFSWVLSSARRQVRDSATAEDVAQAAFILLARKPPTLRADATLSPWLFGVVHRTCLTALRSQTRRRHHETKAAIMNSEVIEAVESPEWASLAPHLDALLQVLKPDDRQVLLLRFFERKSLAEVGLSIGVSEEASRKRVDRALDRLRELAAKRNVRVAMTGTLGSILLLHATQSASAHLAPTISANALAAIAPGAAPTAASILANAVSKSLLRSALKVPLMIGSIAAILLIGVTSVIFAVSNATTPNAVASQIVSVPATPATKPANGKLRVGYIVSKFTVKGPGRSFNGGTYTHAHPKVVPALADKSVEMWAVLEPGTDQDPSIAQIAEEVFGGRQLNGGDVTQLKTCDVIVAAGIRNATPEVLQAVTRAVEGGVGLMIWIPIGMTAPGERDSLVRKLNALDDAPNHGGTFSLEWLDATVVGSHPILGNLSGKLAAPVKFRPELATGLNMTCATPLVKLEPEAVGDPAYYPLYVSTLGKGRIVHLGFSTFTQIPKEFDAAVGGHFALRCLNWLAGREVPLLATTQRSASTTKASQ